jgi:hypothetical protein
LCVLCAFNPGSSKLWDIPQRLGTQHSHFHTECASNINAMARK